MYALLRIIPRCLSWSVFWCNRGNPTRSCKTPSSSMLHASLQGQRIILLRLTHRKRDGYHRSSSMCFFFSYRIVKIVTTSQRTYFRINERTTTKKKIIIIFPSFFFLFFIATQDDLDDRGILMYIIKKNIENARRYPTGLTGSLIKNVHYVPCQLIRINLLTPRVLKYKYRYTRYL